METTTLISPQDLAATTEAVIIIDTRDPSEYAIAHIPNAVNIRDILPISPLPPQQELRLYKSTLPNY